MIDYRKLPPVEPVEVPRRFSMTLMERHDDCPRAAYLGVKHRMPGSHNLDRGILGHAVLERAMKELMRMGERQFSPDDPEQAASIMHAFVDEQLRARPELVVPRRDVDDVRELAYHWAVGYDVDPEHVAGLEQLMVLDLDCGVTLSGKMDLIALPSIDVGQVDDYKTGRALVTQEEYDGKVQPWFYAVLLVYGAPVTVTPCWNCDAGTVPIVGGCPICDGRGRYEERGEPGALGGHLKGVWTREVYPHPKPRDDGSLHRREMLLAKTAIADYRADLERAAETLRDRFESWDFPARSSGGTLNGSWCSRCPAPHECPLPAELRNHAGTINSLPEAEEAWAKAQHDKARIAAIEKEVKNFAKAHNVPIRVGDQEWTWTPKQGRAVRKVRGRSDWDGLVAAVVEARDFGTRFDVSEFVVPTAGSEFKKSKVTGETG